MYLELQLETPMKMVTEMLLELDSYMHSEMPMGCNLIGGSRFEKIQDV